MLFAIPPVLPEQARETVVEAHIEKSTLRLRYRSAQGGNQENS